MGHAMSDTAADTQRMIDECLDWFDFDKVKRAMDALNWRWAVIDETTDGADRVPETGELRRAARRHLQTVAPHIDGDHPYRSVSGGFEALAYQGTLTLQFILAGWQADRPEAAS